MVSTLYLELARFECCKRILVLAREVFKSHPYKTSDVAERKNTAVDAFHVIFHPESICMLKVTRLINL